MPEIAEVSPNEPDILPDYVDADADAGNRVGPSPISPLPEPGEMAGAPPHYVDIESMHLLNAEFAPIAGSGAERGGEAEFAGGQESVEETAIPPDDTAGEVPVAVESRHREGECVPNIPDVSPEFVPEDTVVKSSPTPVAAARPASAGVAVPSWMRWVYFTGTALVAALFGMFVFSQAVSSLALAAALPGWAQYALLIPLGLCAAVVLAVAAGLVLSWLRLRTFRQISIASLEELHRRAETRRDGVEHFQAARASLEDYVKSYPLDEAGRKRLSAAGLSGGSMDSLASERDRLLVRSVDSRSWLGEFREHFQSGVDRAAAARVNSLALKAAGCAVASPLPLLDSTLVLGISLKMIRDLCVLYNVRGSPASSLVLLNRAVITAFIAGVADEAAAGAGEMAGEAFGGVLGETAAGTIGAGVLRAIGPKAGEGAVNYLFVHRLGKAAARLLQPLKPE